MSHKLLENIDFTNDPELIAKRYLGNFHEQNYFYSIDDVSKSNNNISLVADDSSLEFITKRLSLISDMGIISHRTDKPFKYLYQSNYSNYAFDSGDSEESYSSLHVDVPDLANLGNWISKCRDLIVKNSILYVPRIKTELFHQVYGYSGSGPSIQISEPIVDAIFRDKKLAELSESNPVKSKYVKSIVSLNIPVIDNVDLELFSKVTSDDSSQVENLRRYLREMFLEIANNETSEHFYSKMEVISLRMKRELAGLTEDFRALEAKRTFQISGSTVTTMTATLVAINSNLFDVADQIIGASGGLYLFLQVLLNGKLSKDKIKQNPFYYFWYLENKTK